MIQRKFLPSEMDVQVKESTVGPLVKGQPRMDSVAIWVRGCKPPKGQKCVVCCQMDDGSIRKAEVEGTDDFIHLFFYDSLAPAQHNYRAGYFHGYGDEKLRWTSMDEHQFVMTHPLDPLDFVLGSCRRYIDGPFNFGTHEGDIIFRAIQNKHPQFVLNVGDKVYFDPLGSLTAREDLKSMRSLYRKIYNMEHQRSLYQQTIGFDMGDDHDFQCNDAGQKTRLRNRKSFASGLCAYREYQHYSGPVAGAGEDFWYSFNRGDNHFFVFDVRTERCELDADPKIISNKQMGAFLEWVTDPEKKDQYKFVVSSSPMVSQVETDSWSGFPRQQRKVIDALLGKDRDGNNINKVVLLVGDAHCSRTAVYDVYDSFEIGQGRVIEVLSSGLVATGHDQGKAYTKFTPVEEYNKNNNFPHTIDHTGDGGLKFVTQFASPCYPSPAKPSGLDRIRAPFKRVVDNVFVRITEGDNELFVTTYNQDGEELHQIPLKL